MLYDLFSKRHPSHVAVLRGLPSNVQIEVEVGGLEVNRSYAPPDHVLGANENEAGKFSFLQLLFLNWLRQERLCSLS